MVAPSDEGGRLPSQRPGASDPVTPGDDGRPGPVPEPAVAADHGIPRGAIHARLIRNASSTSCPAALRRCTNGPSTPSPSGSRTAATAAEDLVQESYLRLVREVQAGRATRQRPGLALSRVRQPRHQPRSPCVGRHAIPAVPRLARGRRDARGAPPSARARIRAVRRPGGPEPRRAHRPAPVGRPASTVRRSPEIIGRSHGATRTMLTRARMKVQARLAGRGRPPCMTIARSSRWRRPRSTSSSIADERNRLDRRPRDVLPLPAPGRGHACDRDGPASPAGHRHAGRVRDVVIGSALRAGRRAPGLRSVLAASLSILVVLGGTAVVIGTPRTRDPAARIAVGRRPSPRPVPASPERRPDPPAPERTPARSRPCTAAPARDDPLAQPATSRRWSPTSDW